VSQESSCPSGQCCETQPCHHGSVTDVGLCLAQEGMPWLSVCCCSGPLQGWGCPARSPGTHPLGSQSFTSSFIPQLLICSAAPFHQERAWSFSLESLQQHWGKHLAVQTGLRQPPHCSLCPSAVSPPGRLLGPGAMRAPGRAPALAGPLRCSGLLPGTRL